MTKKVINSHQSQNYHIDYSVVKDLLCDFMSAFGFSFALLDSEYRLVFETKRTSQFCLKPLSESMISCRQCIYCRFSHIERSKEEKKIQIYVNRVGLIEFCFPLIKDDIVLGFIIGGHIRIENGVEDEEPGSPIIFSDQYFSETFNTKRFSDDWYKKIADSVSPDASQYYCELSGISPMSVSKLKSVLRIFSSIIQSASSSISLEMPVNSSSIHNESYEKEVNIGQDFSTENLSGEFNEEVQIISKAVKPDVLYLYQYNPASKEFSFPPVVTGETGSSRRIHLSPMDRIISRTIRTGQPFFTSRQDAEAYGIEEDFPEKLSHSIIELIQSEEFDYILTIPIFSKGVLHEIGLAGFRSSGMRKKQVLQDAVHEYDTVTLPFSFLKEIAVDKLRVCDANPDFSLEQDETESAGRIFRELRRAINFTKATIQLIIHDKRILLAFYGFKGKDINHTLLRPVSQDRLIQSIISSRTSLVIPDVVHEENWRSTQETSDIRSWIGIPVFFSEHIIGLITLDHTSPGFFNQDSLTKILPTVSKIKPQVWHLYKMDISLRFIRNMKIVNEIVQIINAEMKVNDLLSAFATQVFMNLGCSHCTVFLENNDNGKMLLRPIDAKGMETITVKNFEPDEGIAGWVYRNGQSMLLEDARNNPHFIPGWGDNDQPRSMIAVPIIVNRKTFAVICVQKFGYGTFDIGNLELIEALAVHAGIAVQRCLGLNLVEKMGNEILSSVFSRPKDKHLSPRKNHVEEILKLVYEEAISLLNVDMGGIYLFDENCKRVTAQFFYNNFKYPEPRLEKKNGLTRTIIRTKEILVIPDTSLDKRVNPDLVKEFQSMIGIPLKVNDNVIGAFYLDSREQHTFTESEKVLLSILSSQAAITIKYEELLSRLEKQITHHKKLEKQLEGLHRVYKEQNLTLVLDKIVEGICKIFDKKITANIRLYFEERDGFGEYHGSGPLKKLLKELPRSEEIGGGTVRYVLKTRKPLYIEDVLTPPEGCPTVRKTSIDKGVVSFAGIPLIHQEHIVGVLCVNAQERFEFSEDDKRILEIFASQAAVVIENTRLYVATQFSGLIKAADIGFLASGLAHEFNNDLQRLLSIVIEIEFLDTEDQRIEWTDKYIKQIQIAANRIDTFRSIKNSPDTIRVFDLEKMINELLELLRQRLKDHHIEIQKNLGVRDVSMNESLVNTVIINMLRNACDAVEGIESEKRIIIETRKNSLNDEVEITISDNGPGIPPENMEKIFLPYYSTKPGSKNMGIGLFLVSNIISRIGGKIHVEPKNAEGGVTMTVTLPDYLNG